MSAHSGKSKDCGPLLLIILLFVCLGFRLVAWIPYYFSDTYSFVVTDTMRDAYNNFGQSILFSHTTPPLAYILNKIAFLFSDSIAFHILSVMVLGMSLIAVALIYKSCILLNANRYVAFFVTLMYTLVMTRHHTLGIISHDDPVYVLCPCLIWVSLNYLKSPTNRRALFIGLFSGLLVWTSPVPGLVAVCLTFILMVFVHSDKIKRRTRLASLLLAIFFLVSLGIKNYVNVSRFHISTKGGQSGMQLLLNITAWDKNQLMSFAKRANPPEWWQWCYENSPSVVTGECYLDDGKFNYRPLYHKLVSLGEDDLARKVLKDEEDQFKRPWKFFIGDYEEASRRISAQYSAIGQKMWFQFIIERPVTFLFAAVNNMNKFFIYEGPLWLSSASLITQAKMADNLTRLLSIFFAVILWEGVGIAYLYVVVLIFKIGEIILSRKDIFIKLGAMIRPIQFLSIGFVLHNFLFVIATCCENQRLFWMAAPYVAILAAIVMSQALKLLDNQEERVVGVINHEK